MRLNLRRVRGGVILSIPVPSCLLQVRPQLQIQVLLRLLKIPAHFLIAALVAVPIIRFSWLLRLQNGIVHWLSNLFLWRGFEPVLYLLFRVETHFLEILLRLHNELLFIFTWWYVTSPLFGRPGDVLFFLFFLFFLLFFFFVFTFALSEVVRFFLWLKNHDVYFLKFLSRFSESGLSFRFLCSRELRSRYLRLRLFFFHYPWGIRSLIGYVRLLDHNTFFLVLELLLLLLSEFFEGLRGSWRLFFLLLLLALSWRLVHSLFSERWLDLLCSSSLQSGSWNFFGCWLFFFSFWLGRFQSFSIWASTCGAFHVSYADRWMLSNFNFCRSSWPGTRSSSFATFAQTSLWFFNFVNLSLV